MNKKTQTILVQGKEIGISHTNETHDICLTDMVGGEEGNYQIRNGMRSRNTLEFIGL